ncbi:amidohydrolase [Calidifontibacter sp. DB0510]|uniref:Amidohydrolase n=1 Tax=Metallococcus carri TaxID=1656884 RepID=A0A967AZZ2_9MICO|nr:M20 family metallopeptidase [Metallococcus carri]NHN56234.1 amidohydrolase [Metallococcus carri]NOP38714.1 amidohydrolase [Calidifontibacter sp. DB2511S]
MTIVDEALLLGPQLSALRRTLHQIPELGLRLPQTQAVVLEQLAELDDIEITTGRELDSVTVVLRGKARPDGPVVLLRGDMDALPVVEQTEVDYRSTNGCMHACGHDLHVAGLMGALRLLHARRDELAGDVVFMFQPGEEGGGGAEVMLTEGVLDAAGRPVEAAYALHVAASQLPRGHWASRPGTCMAAAEDVRITLHGAGGHGSQPQEAKDPIPAIAELVTALQTRVTREFDVFDPVVITVGSLHAGTASNIIPDDAHLVATVRSLGPQTRERARRVIERVATGIATAHDVRAEFHWFDSYPATINDDTAYDLGVQVIRDLFGDDAFTERRTPEMGAEDFSFVLERVPGAYFFLGACPSDEPEGAPDNHSPRAAFDDSVLPYAAAWLAEMALRRCGMASSAADPTA